MRATRYRMIGVLLSISFLSIDGMGLQEPTLSDKAAIEAVRSVVEKIQACPVTEQVAQFKKKWAKVAWGPPRSVKFDVERTASVISPHKGIIEFSIAYSGGDQHKTREEAQNDKNLRPIFLSAIRYTLRVSGDSKISAESMRIANALTGEWSDYHPVGPERFCWINRNKLGT